MTSKELKEIRTKYVSKLSYKFCYYTDFNYSILDNVMFKVKVGRGSHESYNDVLMMLDTETSKECENDFIIEKHKGIERKKYIPVRNYIVIWTLSIRFFNKNICTLYGRNPLELTDCIEKILEHLKGDKTLLFVHNLSYDNTFLEKFFFKKFGFPEKQLNTKSHYPISISYKNGLILRDSLILAQRKLDSWGKDLSAEHHKLLGSWKYDVIRHQNTVLSDNELSYAENDTLVGVECLDIIMSQLKKCIYSLPMTATGIPRNELYLKSKKQRAKEWFLQTVLPLDLYLWFERWIYHGGYSHGNRNIIGELFDYAECRDFASSYPFSLIVEKYVSSQFVKIDDGDIDVNLIIENMDNYAYVFTLVLLNVDLIDDDVSMPFIQVSKCQKLYEPICDNGRVLSAKYLEISYTEQDLYICLKQYKFDRIAVVNCYYAQKDYLPNWFRDYVFECYKEKCELKFSDNQALYNIAKSKVNSLYGMAVQKPLKEDIIEDYETGEYIETEMSKEEQIEKYQEYIDNPKKILPYHIGVYCTAYATRHLFDLAECIDYENGGLWLYSDTDSIYSNKWNEEKLKIYNDNVKQKLIDSGYDKIIVDGHTFWLGIAEIDGVYSEFITVGSKRYACRYAEHEANKKKVWNKLKITVAGVPKEKGVLALNDNILNFKKGLIFDGELTGKKTHAYVQGDITTNAYGDIVADSVDLMPCDYLLDSVDVFDWRQTFDDELIGEYFE